MLDGDPWNHNIHYHPVVLAEIPYNAERALDVGCGEGVLTRRLHQRVRHVVGINLDEASVAKARSQPLSDIDYVLGDFMTYPFEPESFDFIASVASLHHMAMGAALGRMGSLLLPAGRVVVIGLARSRQPLDLPLDLAGLVAHHVHKRSRNEAEDGAPKVWPPPLTFGQTRRVATRTLPGATYRRRLLWRYSLAWTKPA